jgi:hypothetical protein
MIAAAAVSLFLQSRYGPQWNSDDPEQFAWLMLTTVGITTIAWLVITLLTPPEPREKLIAFYRRVRPAGPGWRPIAAVAKDVQPVESLAAQFINWILGCVLIYTTLFAIGKLIFKDWLEGFAYTAVALVAAILISRNLSSVRWREPSPGES